MSAFKEIIAADIHRTFLNLDEFSDTHTINGTDMPCQVDSNEQIEREKRYMSKNDILDGLYSNQKLIYVAADNYGPMPKQGSLLTMDGKKYRVADAVEEMGVYSITIEANRA